VGAYRTKRDISNESQKSSVGEITGRTFFLCFLKNFLNCCKSETMEEKLQHDNDNSKISILIVDDHSIVRRGLIQLINQEPDLRVCGEAENALQALEIIEKQQVDLAIVDISLNGTNGIQLTEKIKSMRPNLPVLILTMHDEVAYAKRALRAGVEGYVTKSEAAEKIVTAIRQVLCGKEYISKTVVHNSLRKLRAEEPDF
jgi:DNA-binding NarL/FixJ family response regulator